jgi:DNA-binding transcriptional MerR regulator
MATDFTPTKLYYKIGEASEIVGLEAHVLRYWETEFPALSPPKNKGGQRTYRPKDIELLLKIRGLLYEEGFTIAGARKQLNRPAAGESRDPAAGALPRAKRKCAAKPPEAPKGRINKVREELENILTLLDRG